MKEFLFRTTEKQREIVLFEYILKKLLELDDISDIVMMYKQNRIGSDKKELFIKIGNIYKDIINSLHPLKYKIICETSQIIFNNIKNLVYFSF